LIQALNEVSFNISQGEIVGLLGPNGAGKTTIMKIITGYLQPDDGDIFVDDLDVLTDPRQVQERIGYLPENAPVYHELSVQSYLLMISELRQVREADRISHISEAIRAAGLMDVLTQPIGELSKGMRQRVGLAQAILHQPRILILDEPTIGLDPTQVVEVRDLIRRLAQQSTVLFSTHILSEVEALCDRVIILINGEVKADSRISDLASTADAILVLGKKVRGVEKSLMQLAQVRGTEQGKSSDGYPQYRVMGTSRAESTDLCPAVYELARKEGWPLRELRKDVRTLETVFNELATAA
jgi:ABC-2 type transport system ATP-binding protein